MQIYASVQIYAVMQIYATMEFFISLLTSRYLIMFLPLSISILRATVNHST